MNDKNDELRAVFEELSEYGTPTQEQRDEMLSRVLLECKADNVTATERLRRLVLVRPWVLAFGVSAVQAAALTLIFGSGYTSLFLSFIGG